MVASIIKEKQSSKARTRVFTWNRSWDQLSLNLGQTGTLDMTRQVGPVQPVCVPGQIEGQDAIVGGEQMGLTGPSLPKLQLDDAIPGCINKARICWRDSEFYSIIQQAIDSQKVWKGI